MSWFWRVTAKRGTESVQLLRLRFKCSVTLLGKKNVSIGSGGLKLLGLIVFQCRQNPLVNKSTEYWTDFIGNPCKTLNGSTFRFKILTVLFISLAVVLLCVCARSRHGPNTNVASSHKYIGVLFAEYIQLIGICGTCIKVLSYYLQNSLRNLL